MPASQVLEQVAHALHSPHVQLTTRIIKGLYINETCNSFCISDSWTPLVEGSIYQLGTSDVKLPAFVLHVRVAISQRDAVEFPKEIIVLKSAMQWSKTDVIKSHRHLSNAFLPTVRCTAFPTH